MAPWLPWWWSEVCPLAAKRRARDSGRQADGEGRDGDFLMLSNPVCRKPFRGARREVSGAALEREGAANQEENMQTFPQVPWTWLVRDDAFIREKVPALGEQCNYRVPSLICLKWKWSIQSFAPMRQWDGLFSLCCSMFMVRTEPAFWETGRNARLPDVRN